ncbi:MAG: hypothetical protein M1334_00330 [Patescibacteria group bacterium]|nr:hypothetical protein [Patescibacteria group bacterium]
MKRIKYYYLLAKYHTLFAVKVIWIKITKPWIIARFYASWVEYQKGVVYRERLTDLGPHQAIFSFIEDKWTQNYCLKLRLQKEPGLKWRILFAPFTIEKPYILDIARESGFFSRG